MAVTKPLVGKTVTLRCAETQDAQFIIDLRNDSELSKYLPKLEVTIDEQKRWIERQRALEGDYYFVIWNNDGERIGTLSIYDIDNDHGENGRMANIGSAIEILEAEYLVHMFTFDVLNLQYFTSEVAIDNSSALKMVDYFGGTLDDGFFELNGMRTIHARTYRKDFMDSKKKIERILAR